MLATQTTFDRVQVASWPKTVVLPVGYPLKDLKILPGSSTLRMHFDVNDKVLKTLLLQPNLTKEVFDEFVFDADYQLLQKGYWLLLRTTPDDSKFWRIRKVERINNVLEWRETSDVDGILNVLKLLGLKKLTSTNSPSDYCSCFAASLETTRIRFGDNEHLWLDFSSWVHPRGKSGMYVIGSAIIDGSDYTLDQLRIIFDNENLFCIPSKYFVCMLDCYPEAFGVAFTDKDKEEGEKIMRTYPILRKPDSSPYEQFHIMKTVEDLKSQDRYWIKGSIEVDADSVTQCQVIVNFNDEAAEKLKQSLARGNQQ
eukprot:TRINITY_DN680_c0_g1_i2.p1 TRINITY_DN680_c0_g1~~TRINITY_DN680_c0_g1_i2.p1  ORF type:complete len:311 (-),score=35.00 TRINITY_DN680_c0_g1_i2:60-992(-)